MKHTSLFDRDSSGLFPSMHASDGISKVECDDDNYKILVDVKDFLPEELIIKTVGNTVHFEAKHEEKTADGHSYTSRYVYRDSTHVATRCHVPLLCLLQEHLSELHAAPRGRSRARDELPVQGRHVDHLGTAAARSQAAEQREARAYQAPIKTVMMQGEDEEDTPVPYEEDDVRGELLRPNHVVAYAPINRPPLFPLANVSGHATGTTGVVPVTHALVHLYNGLSQQLLHGATTKTCAYIHHTRYGRRSLTWHKLLRD